MALETIAEVLARISKQSQSTLQNLEEMGVMEDAGDRDQYNTVIERTYQTILLFGRLPDGIVNYGHARRHLLNAFRAVCGGPVSAKGAVEDIMKLVRWCENRIPEEEGF